MQRGDDHAWSALFEGLDRKGGQFLQIQLRQRIVAAIVDGRLKPNVRLPSSRRLASLLGIGRNTVILSYDQLLDEKVLISRDRSGVYVSANLSEGAIRRDCDSEVPSAWMPRLAFRPSELRQITKPKNWMDYPYPFLFGQFDPSLFPMNDWRESVRAASSASEIGEWSVDRMDEDDEELLAEVCSKVLPRRGIWATPDEVTITLGAQQALYMVARLVSGNGARIGIEDPCYPDLRNMLQVNGVDPVLLTMDRQGAVPDEAFGACDAVFLTPNHQCPTTVTMEPARRDAVMAMATKTDTLIIEDDYEADLFKEADEKPALKSLAVERRVVYVGSLSKVLAPGLRLGFTVARREITDELRAYRRMMLRHAPANNQRAMAMFLSLGHHRSHLRRLAAVLKDRSGRIEGRLDELPRGFRWRREPGATSFWIVGPRGFDAKAMSSTARSEGVLVEAGDVFYAEPSDGASSFRLGFAAIRSERIDEGLTRLFQTIARFV